MVEVFFVQSTLISLQITIGDLAFSPIAQNDEELSTGKNSNTFFNLDQIQGLIYRNAQREQTRLSVGKRAEEVHPSQ